MVQRRVLESGGAAPLDDEERRRRARANAEARDEPAVPFPELEEPPTGETPGEAPPFAPPPPVDLGEPILEPPEVVRAREQRRFLDSVEALFPDLLVDTGITEEGRISAANSIIDFANDDFEGFLETLRSKGLSPESDFLLRASVQGITDEEVLSFFAPREQDPVIITEAPTLQRLDIALRAVFPGQNVDETVRWARENNEAFLEELLDIGLNENTKFLYKAAFPAVTDLEVVEFFDQKTTQPSNAFLDAIETGVQFVSGWWQVGLMESGFSIQRSMENAEFDTSLRTYINLGRPGSNFRDWRNAQVKNRRISEAELMLDRAFAKHGWKAVFSGEVSEAWDVYFEEREVKGINKFVSEMSNPVWYIPIGGGAGWLAMTFNKVPVLGKTLQGTARGIQAVEGAPLLPFRGARALATKAFGTKPFTPAATDRFLIEKIPTDAELDQALFKDNTFRRVANHIPGLRKVAPATGLTELPPTLATKSEIENAVSQAVLKRNAILEMGESTKGQALAALRELGTTKQIYGVSKEGLASPRLVTPKFEGESLALGDIVRAPERYIFKHPNGLEYAKRAQSITKEMFDLTVKEGVDIKKQQLEEFQEFVHWVVTGKIKKDGVLEATRKGGKGVVGGTPSSLKHHRFELMMDGIKAGYRYGDDLETYVASYIDDLFKVIGDKRLGEGLDGVVGRVEDILPTKPLERLIAVFLYPLPL